jgi:DNA-binding transcriptional regulator/RsmH inhibitor MraZ
MDYFERKLDDKNRLTLPKELRLEFGDKVVIYLHMYPEKVWQQDMESALRGSILDQHVADLNVQFRSGKTVATVDQKQGRVTFEAHQLSYAGIDRDVVAVRAGNYFRIMAKS